MHFLRWGQIKTSASTKSSLLHAPKLVPSTSLTHKSHWLLWHAMWYVIMCVLFDWFPTAWCVWIAPMIHTWIYAHIPLWDTRVAYLWDIINSEVLDSPIPCLLVNTLIIWVWINSRAMSEFRYLVGENEQTPWRPFTSQTVSFWPLRTTEELLSSALLPCQAQNVMLGSFLPSWGP